MSAATLREPGPRPPFDTLPEDDGPPDTVPMPPPEGVEVEVTVELTAKRGTRRPPATRAECAELPRPCPRSACRHHLGRRAGETNCSLDVADAGGATVDEVAALLGLSHGMAHLIETRALLKLRRAGLDLGGAP